VVGDEVLRPTDELGELADLTVASCQLLKQLPALLVGQELEKREGETVEVTFGDYINTH